MANELEIRKEIQARLIACQRYQAALKDIATIIPFSLVGQLDSDSIEAMKHAVMSPQITDEETKPR